MTNREAIISYLTNELDRAVIERDDTAMDVVTQMILRFTSSRAARTQEDQIAANRRAAGFFNPDDTTRTEED